MVFIHGRQANDKHTARDAQWPRDRNLGLFLYEELRPACWNIKLYISPMDQTPANRRLAYMLGRKSAPLFFKVNWVMKSLAGTDDEKIEAEFQLGYLLSKVYEEKVPVIRNNRLA